MALGIVSDFLYHKTGVNQHWRPIEKGRIWKRIEVETDEKKRIFQQHMPTGDLYRNENPDWACLKGFGVLLFGKYVYAGVALRQAGEGIWKGGQKLDDAWKSFKLLKTSRDFNLSTFAQNEISNFKAAGAHFMQAAKFGVVAAALHLDPAFWGISCFGYGIVNMVLGAYTLYNPLGFRTWVHRVNQWCIPANVSKMKTQDIKNLSVWKVVTAALEGRLSPLYFLKMEPFGNIKDLKPKEEAKLKDNDSVDSFKKFNKELEKKEIADTPLVIKKDPKEKKNE